LQNYKLDRELRLPGTRLSGQIQDRINTKNNWDDAKAIIISIFGTELSLPFFIQQNVKRTQADSLSIFNELYKLLCFALPLIEHQKWGAPSASHPILNGF
jgi:hypothetical protein